MTKIDSTARVSSKAYIGKGVDIGPWSIIHENTIIEDDCSVGAFCELGLRTDLASQTGLRIGASSTIRSHSVVYEGCSFGEGLVTGHRVTIRENTIAEEGLQVGSLSELSGNISIGRHVKCHSNVHICQTAKLGNYIWIFPYVVLLNDPHPPSEILDGPIVEDFCIIAAKSTVLPGVTLGHSSLVGAGTLVCRDVPSGELCLGVPGKNQGPAERILHRTSGEPAYPWRRHFHRGYPDGDVDRWMKEFGRLD